MAWRTDITVLLFVVIALTKGNLNVVGEWNLYGSLTPNQNLPHSRYIINHIKAAAPPTVPPRRDRTNARLSGTPVAQFSAAKTNNQAASSFSAVNPQMGPIKPQMSLIQPQRGPTQAQLNSLNAINSGFGSQKMVLIDKDMGQVQIQPGSFTDKVVIRDPSRAITYSQPYSVSHRKLTPWQQPPSTLPPPMPVMPAKTLPKITKITIVTPPPVKSRFQFTMADGLKVRRGNLQYVSSRPPQNPERQENLQHVVQTQHNSSKDSSPVEVLFQDNRLPTPVTRQSKQNTNSYNFSVSNISNQHNRKQLVVDLTHSNKFTNTIFNLPSSSFDSEKLLLKDVNNFHKRNKRQTVDRRRSSQNRTRDVHTVLMGNASWVDSLARRNRQKNKNRIKTLRESRKRKRLKKQNMNRMKASPSKSKNDNNMHRNSAIRPTQFAKNDLIPQKSMSKNSLVSELGRRRAESGRKQINPSLPELQNRPRYSQNRPSVRENNVKSKSKERTNRMQNSGTTPKHFTEMRSKSKSDGSFSPRANGQRYDVLPYNVESNTKLSDNIAKNRMRQRPRNIYIVISSGRRDNSRGKGRGIRHYSMNDRARYRYIEDLITKGHEMMEKLHSPRRLTDRGQVKYRPLASQRNRNSMPQGRKRDFKQNKIKPGPLKKDLQPQHENKFKDNEINNIDKPVNKDTDVLRKRNLKSSNQSKMGNKSNHNENVNKSSNENVYFVNETDNIDQDLRNILSNPLKVLNGSERKESNRTKMFRNGELTDQESRKMRHKNETPVFNKQFSSLKGDVHKGMENNNNRQIANRNMPSHNKSELPSLFKNEHPLTKPFNAFQGRQKRHRDRQKNPKREPKLINRSQIEHSYEVKNHMKNRINRKHYDGNRIKAREENRVRYGQKIPKSDTKAYNSNLRNGRVKNKPSSNNGDSDTRGHINKLPSTQTKTNESQDDKPIGGSKGRNIRNQDDVVKYKFLETVKNRSHKLSSINNLDQDIKSSFRMQIKNGTNSDIDYKRVDGYSNQTSQGKSENDALKRRKQNISDTETKQSTSKIRENHERPLVSNPTQDSELMTNNDVDNGTLSSTRHRSSHRTRDKMPTVNDSTGSDLDQARNPQKNSKSNRKRKTGKLNFDKNNENKKRSRTRSKLKSNKKKKGRSKSKSKIRKTKTRKPRSTYNSKFAHPPKVSLLLYLKRKSKIRAASRHREADTSYKTKINGQRDLNSSSKFYENNHKNMSINKSDLLSKHDKGFVFKRMKSSFSHSPNKSNNASSGKIVHKVTSSLHSDMAEETSITPSSIILSSFMSTEGNTSKSNESGLVGKNTRLAKVEPSFLVPKIRAPYVKLNSNSSAYLYEMNPSFAKHDENTIFKWDRKRNYALVNLKSYLESGPNRIKRKIKRHSGNVKYSSNNQQSRPYSIIKNKNDYDNKKSFLDGQQGGGLSQLPILTFTTINGTLTNVSGLAGLSQRKYGINVTLTRLAEIKTNLHSQMLTPGNAQGAGGRGANPPPPNHGPPPGPIYPVNRAPAGPPQPRYNPPPPQWNHHPMPQQNQWNHPPPQRYHQNQPPTHPPRYLPPPTHPPRHYFPPPRRTRPTPPPYRPPKTTKPTTTTTTTTKKPEIEYDIEGPRTTQAPPPTRTRPTARPKCDYWSMDPFGNLQFYPCQRPVFRPPTTTPAPAPLFYFYDAPTPDPWKWYDYPNEVKIEVKVERDTNGRTK